MLCRKNCGSIFVDLASVQLKMELQPETLEVASTCVVDNTYSACNEVELLEVMAVVLVIEFDNVHIRSPKIYNDNNGFALFVVEKILLEISYELFKGANIRGDRF